MVGLTPVAVLTVIFIVFGLTIHEFDRHARWRLLMLIVTVIGLTLIRLMVFA